MRGLLLLLGVPLWAQIGAPSLGYFEEGRRLRAVSGIPASASVGAVLDLPEFSVVAAAPGQNWAIGALAASGETVVYRAGSILNISGAGIAPSSIMFSPEGTAALLWFGESKRLQVVRNLSGSPEAQHIGFVDNAPAALAVSDDGEVVAGLWGSELRVFGPEGRSKQRTLDGPRALAFFHNSHELAVASHDTLWLGESTSTLPAGDVIAIGFTAGNRMIVFAKADGKLISRNIADGSTVEADCSCNPQGLFQTTGSTFRFTGLQQGGYRLFDAETGQILAAPLSVDQLHGVQQ